MINLSSLGISRVRRTYTNAFVKFEETLVLLLFFEFVGRVQSASAFSVEHLTAIITS